MVTSSSLFNLVGNPFLRRVSLSEKWKPGSSRDDSSWSLNLRGRWLMFNSSLVSSLACIPYRSIASWSSSATSLQLWIHVRLFRFQVCGIVVVPHHHPIIKKSNPYWQYLEDMKVQNAVSSLQLQGTSSQGLDHDDSPGILIIDREARFCSYSNKIWNNIACWFGVFLVLQRVKELQQCHISADSVCILQKYSLSCHVL
jgi:hypothetical protein